MFKIYFLIINIITIEFDNLIKDAVLENMKTKEYKKFNYNNKIDRRGDPYWILPQSFQQTLIDKTNLKEPFLLIPLFKIKNKEYNKYKEVNFSLFENNLCNTITLQFLTFYFIGYHYSYSLLNSSIRFIIKNKELIELTKEGSKARNGFLIFKDPNSNCAMLYLGIFINELYFKPENKSLFYNYLILNNYKNNEIKPEDISFEIKIDKKALLGNLEIVLNRINDNCDFNLTLFPPLIENEYSLTIFLNGRIINEKLYFDIKIFHNQIDLKNSFLIIKNSN